MVHMFPTHSRGVSELIDLFSSNWIVFPFRSLTGFSKKLQVTTVLFSFTPLGHNFNVLRDYIIFSIFIPIFILLKNWKFNFFPKSIIIFRPNNGLIGFFWCSPSRDENFTRYFLWKTAFIIITAFPRIFPLYFCLYFARHRPHNSPLISFHFLPSISPLFTQELFKAILLRQAFPNKCLTECELEIPQL